MISKYVLAGTALVALLSAAAAAFLFFQLRDTDQRLGKVEGQLKTALQANEAKSNATSTRGRIDNSTRKLAPADKLDRM